MIATLKALLAPAAGRIGWVLVGALLLFLLVPERRPEIGGAALIRHVAADVLTDAEPDTVIRWRERIVYRDAPVLTRERADSAAADDVTAFCAAVAAGPATGPPARPEEGDVQPAAQPAPSPALPLAFVRSWEQRGSQLSLWTVRSDLALERQRYQVCPWSHAGRMQGDVASVTTVRACWLRDAALAIGVGALVYGAVQENLTAAGIGAGTLIGWRVFF